MEQNYLTPVYPKTDPEYRKRVMDGFYKKVRETNWGYDDSEYQGKPRGRKAKVVARVEAKPRTKSEEKLFTNKFFNYNK
jgi:hypothetical protein